MRQEFMNERKENEKKNFIFKFIETYAALLFSCVLFVCALYICKLAGDFMC